MRVLYFSRSYTSHDRRFLVELAGSRYETWYLRLEDDRVRYEVRPVPDGVRELAPLGGGEDRLRLVPRLEAVLEQVQPDVVHAGPIQSCAFLTALAGFHPLLAMSWGSDLLVDAHRDEFWEWMTRYTLRRADRLITDCAEVSEAAVRIAGVPRERIVQFPWGVDLGRFHPGPDTLGLRRRPGWEDGILVIATRSWEPGYGVLHLLAAFAEAHAKAPRLRLALLGSGSQRAQVEGFLREQRLEKAVLLAGAVAAERLPEYFRAVDLYASCAYSDGSSLSLLEAMATGLPVLATDRASNREWIAEESQGRLAPFGDVGAIAAGMVELAGLSAAGRREAAVRNRAVVEQRADWKRNAARLLEAYRAVLTS